MTIVLINTGSGPKPVELNKKMLNFEIPKIGFMDPSFNVLLDLIIPEGVSDYFKLSSYSKDSTSIHIYLEEINSTPIEYASNKLQSKGFYDEITLQDFPMRGLDVFLHVKRRRWLNLDINKVVYHNWDLVAKGTRITKDFASFLKEVSRYPST